MTTLTSASEVNFDGIVGPTHNYAGLSYGNLASLKHGLTNSNPKQAALQGLEKMALLMKLGVPQAVLPPQERPNISLLRQLGFSGTNIGVLNQAKKDAPSIFAAAYSASSMWTANMATVSPSIDNYDGRVHFTIANLVSNFHRWQEADTSYRILKKIFLNDRYFSVHPALPNVPELGDEGAANHNRFCLNYGTPGIQLFVWGKSTFLEKDLLPKRFPARQSLEAGESIARLHQLNPEQIIFAEQNPLVIDQGVFHNDVISVANKNFFLYHESAFRDTEAVTEAIKSKFPGHLYLLKVSMSELSVVESVESYLFNSQIVSLSNGTMAIIAPKECEEQERAHGVLLRLVEEENPIQSLHFVNCRESMKNGGGPACLRLRIVLTEEERAASHPGVYLTESLHSTLVAWVNRYYRDQLQTEDLLDPALLEESRAALDELTQILQLGSIYSFQ